MMDYNQTLKFITLKQAKMGMQDAPIWIISQSKGYGTIQKKI